MKYYYKILKYFISVWIISGINFCFGSDFTIDLILLNTGEFTLTNWSNIENLWSVEIDNQRDETIDYYLQFKLIQDNDIKVEGRTKPLLIGPDDGPITYKNLDPIFNQNILAYYYEDSDFISKIENSGYLPPGNYTLELVAFDNEDDLLSSDQEDVEFTLGDHFSIEYPNDGQVIGGESELYFQWDSPGFRQGVQIKFRLIIAAIIPGETINPEDAIEMGSSSVYYFDSEWSELPVGVGWPYVEDGTSQSINTFYSQLTSQTSMAPLVCGYEYAWRMEAREIINEYNDGGNYGIWGWPPDTEKSVVRRFTWGEIPSGLSSSPLSGNDVLPTFTWNSIWCAEISQGDGYDIQITLLDDSEFDNPIYNDISSSSSYSYSELAPGLIPGASYNWRVRVNSIIAETQWSNTETYVIQKIELDKPPLGDFQSTVRPWFNVDGPVNIVHYELLIGDENDQDVEIAEVYNREHKITELPWQYPAQGIENGLFPGTDYWWKLLMFDGSGNILGDIEDYEVWNFRIMPIILTEPANGSLISFLGNNPISFNWNGPQSVPEYVLWISGEEDPEVTNPQDRIIITGSTFFEYPLDGEFPLEYEKTYYWKVVPKDVNHNYGLNSSHSTVYQFNTSELSELNGPLPGVVLTTVRPTFEINTPDEVSYITLQISDENDENVVITPLVYNEPAKKIFPISNSVSWQYPAQDIQYGLHPGIKYYWRYLMYDNNDQLFGDTEDYQIMNFSIEPISLSEPENGGTNIPLNQTFKWEGPSLVPEYEFWMSGEEDPELDNPIIIIDGIASDALEYPEDGEFPLEYEKTYYWRVVPKDINGNYGLSSSYSSVYQFTASDFPEMGEEVSTSNSDVRIPIINIITMEGIEYTIFIYADSEGSSIIEEITGITSFPFTYTEGIETLQYGITYWIQVQPMKNGEEFGSASNLMLFSVPEEPEVTEQCEISCELTDNDEPEILTTILTGLEDATEYLILISENEDMSNPIETIISSSESQYILSSEYVDWGQTYYTQVIAFSEGETVGLPSEIQIINVESKPGMNEQTAISVTLPEGSTIPKFEIINEITGASGYRIIVSTESDMSTELIQFDLNNGITADYDGPPLQYGKSYYVIAQGLDGDELHGIISSVVGIFIPNITPPVLGQQFNWEASIPPADQYLLEVSLVEDFSSIVINQSVQGTTYPLNMDELEYSKGYYWRIQGQSNDGEAFGNPSQVKFFATEDIPEPTLNVISEEVSLTPEFTWTGIDMAAGYQITVASDGGMENILWQENTSSTSAIYPESASLLEFANTYYWQVISLGDDDTPLSQSSIESFSTKSVYPVVGLNPDGGAESITPTLQWETNDKISSYMVYVGSDAEISTVIVNKQVDGNSIEIDAEVLTSGVNYYWMVDGLDENGESIAGPSKVALLILPSTTIISLISPIGDEQVSNLNPLLKWGGLQGASSYSLRVAADPALESPILDAVISGTEATIPEENRLNNSTTYFWQVEGATDNAVILSSIGSFTTPASATINVQSLEDGESISITNPTFSWETEEEIAAFSIRFADNSEFSESWNFQIGTTNFEYPGEPSLNFDTPYYWQVSPLNNEGSSIGEWTNPRSFSISAAFIVELELPGNGETATSSKPTFQWGVIEGISKYEIQVSNNEDFSEILWSSSEIVDNSTSYPGSGAEQLSYGQTYFWHVRAVGEDGPLGDFSSVFSFDLSGENKVKLEGPLDEESEALFPYFSWLSVSGGSEYFLTLASDESISTIIYTTSATDVFVQYPQEAPPLSNGTTYYWNVYAKDENGSKIGDLSNIGSFSTPTGTIEVEFLFGTE